MAMGSELRKEFTDYLDEHDYKYTVVNTEDNIVKLSFTGGVIDKNVYVDFDETLDAHGLACVHFVAQDFATCSDENVAALLLKLNELNKRFRWVKFWFDSSDNTLSCDADAIISAGSTGVECLDYVLHVVSILNKAYEEISDLVTIAEKGPSKDELREFIAMLSKMLGE